MGMSGCFIAVGADQLQHLIADPAQVQGYLYGEDAAAGILDVDKAWHGIHYLLTGEAWGGKAPLSWAVLGGKEIGAEMGYGPARYLTPAQVDAVAQALAGVDEAQLRPRYQPQAMDQATIYPAGIWERDGATGLEYLTHYYKKLVQFYAGAAARGDGMLLWLC